MSCLLSRLPVEGTDEGCNAPEARSWDDDRVRHRQEAVALGVVSHIFALFTAQGVPQCVHVQRPLPNV